MKKKEENKKEGVRPSPKKETSKMYKRPTFKNGTIRLNKAIQGETIEMKIERIVNNKEPIKDGAPPIYTERREGVKKAYNIRTDRFEVAVEAMDKVHGSYQARREERAKLGKKEEPKKDGGPESTQGKSQGDTEVK